MLEFTYHPQYDQTVDPARLVRHARVSPRCIIVQRCYIPDPLLSTLYVWDESSPYRGTELTLYWKESFMMDTGDSSPVYTAYQYREALHSLRTLPLQLLDNMPLLTVLAELPRVDKDDPNMILYLQKPEHLFTDRWTKARAGRYIRRVCPHLVDEEVKRYTANIKGEYAELELCFTEAGDADMVAEVYAKGPNSCMSGTGKYEQHRIEVAGEFYHPMRIMAHPDNDLRLAYMTSQEGDYVARAWVNVKEMTYCTIYSKTDTFHNANTIFKKKLEQAGYRDDEMGTMLGQIIHKVETDCGGIICPYIDPSNVGVGIEADHLIIGADSYEANYETGCLEDYDLEGESRGQCYKCGGDYHLEDMTHVESVDDHVCDDCLESHYRLAVTGYSFHSWDYDYVPSTDCTELVAGTTGRSSYCWDSMLEDYFIVLTAGAHAGLAADIDECHYCEDTDKWWFKPDLLRAGKAYCEDCWVVYSIDEGCPHCGDH